MQLTPDGNNVYGIIYQHEVDSHLAQIIADSLAIRSEDILQKTSNVNGENSLKYASNNDDMIEFLVYQGIEQGELLFNGTFMGESQLIIELLTRLSSRLTHHAITNTFELYTGVLNENLIFQIG